MSAHAAFAPLIENRVFRGLWVASLAANLAMWMHDVAAAWLMTSLTTSPVISFSAPRPSSITLGNRACACGAVATNCRGSSGAFQSACRPLINPSEMQAAQR